jgi:predicted kinase
MNPNEKIISHERFNVCFLSVGLPGSGKSTLAKSISEQGIILSTDDFFRLLPRPLKEKGHWRNLPPNDVLDLESDSRIQLGEYEFQPQCLAVAHQWNMDRCYYAMSQSKGPIIIDNTHVKRWEAKPYVEMAVKFHYAIEIKEVLTEWSKNAESLASKTIHAVPKDKIAHMLAQWDDEFTIDLILQSERPKKFIIKE